jgi:hypothetical protein
MFQSQDSSVGIAVGYRLGSWSSIPDNGKIFLFCVVSRLFLGIKPPGREADHSPPSSAKVKNGGAMPPFPHVSSCHSV